MNLSEFAREHPQKLAVVCATTGRRLTYAELNARSIRLANALHDLGLRKGDHLAVFLDTHVRYLEIVWAAMRSGLYVTPLSRFLTAAEAAYVIDDCEAKVVFSSAAIGPATSGLQPIVGASVVCIALELPVEGWMNYDAFIEDQSDSAKFEAWRGDVMYYTSGTTGRPKGVLRPLGDARVTDGHPRLTATMLRYGFDEDAVFLSTAPLYHGAPLGFSLAAQFLGGTVVIMDRFDAEQSLAAIERFKVTHSQWVPTMFVRLMRLDEASRWRHDLSSHRVAIHSAAPCPKDIKYQMIDWWGPILQEYYRSTEAHGMTEITSAEWLEHPGSVGKAVIGTIRICAEDGAVLPSRAIGTVFFERDSQAFAYFKDEAKTLSALHPVHPHWMTVGDVGYVDEEGYLYLTDRKDFTIISGGVNIYPQMIEDCLLAHPAVADVAVVGAPNTDLGEEARAVVQLTPGAQGGPDMEQELLRFARGRLARNLLPRSFDFVDELPRLPTGKLKKGELRARYWAQQEQA